MSGREAVTTESSMRATHEANWTGRRRGNAAAYVVLGVLVLLLAIVLAVWLGQDDSAAPELAELAVSTEEAVPDGQTELDPAASSLEGDEEDGDSDDREHLEGAEADGTFAVGGFPLFPTAVFDAGENDTDEQRKRLNSTPTLAGRIVDARTGQSLAGAEILAIGYHGAATDLWTAGYPAMYRRQVEVGDDGSFSVPPFSITDPLLRVYLQITKAGYAPEYVVLEREEMLSGRWQSAEVHLRPAEVTAVRVRSRRGRTAVLVTPLEDRHLLADAKQVYAAPRGAGRLVAEREPYVSYPDERGFIYLPRSPFFYYLELLDSHNYLVHRDEFFRKREEGRVRFHTPRRHTETTLRILTYAPYEVLMRDRNGEPIDEALVEVGVSGRKILARTDSEGRLRFGYAERVSYAPDGQVAALFTVRDPRYSRRSVRTVIPEPNQVVTLPADRAMQLTFRTVVVDEETPEPIAPEGIEISWDWTSVHVGLDGVVQYLGHTTSGPLEVRARGYLPAVVELPEPNVDGDYELGDVVLERGRRQVFTVAGAPEQLLAGAFLAVSDVSTRRVHRYPLARAPRGDGRVSLVASGLSAGAHVATVEGPHVSTLTVPFEVPEDLSDDEPIALDVRASPEEFVQVSGTVRYTGAGSPSDLRVIERYFRADRNEPIAERSYAPGPDGSFGSVRRYADVHSVHVAIVDVNGRGTEVFSQRDGEPRFAFGEVTLVRQPRVEVSFFADDVGRVLPPGQVSLKGVDGNEQFARFRLHNHRLYIDNVRRGVYQLTWGREMGRRQSKTISVVSGQVTKVNVTIPARQVEMVPVRVIDSQAQPIVDARVTVDEKDSSLSSWDGLHVPRREDDEPGVRLVAVSTRERTKWHVEANGYLPATVLVEPGAAVPTEIVLYRPVKVVAKIVDVDGTPIDGNVEVSWERTDAVTVNHGVPLFDSVRNGHFDVEGFPPVPVRATFSLQDSAARATVLLTVEENASGIQDIGSIQLYESRTLRGVVLKPDGLPAAKASVAIVEPDRIGRFPLREPIRFEEERHRAVTDAQGKFRIDNLPIRIENGALVAHLDGYAHAYIEPLGVDLEQVELVLRDSGDLTLDVGYRNAVELQDYAFQLEYQSDPDDPETRFLLGEIPSHAQAVATYEAVEPGLYRLTWGLRDGYEPIPALSEEVVVLPGEVSALRLRLDGRTLTGRASLNGVLVKDGWILLTDQPGLTGSFRVGRIVDGNYTIIDPPNSHLTHGVVIPRGTPQALVNAHRGEALPVRVPNYSAALRSGFLHFDYSGRTVTFQISSAYLARYPGAYLSFDGYEWDGDRFRSYAATEAIEDTVVRFQLLAAPGIHRFSIRRERGGLLLSRRVNLIDENIVIRVDAN